MIGKLWCRAWAHKWMFLYTNSRSNAVFGCQRCMRVRADNNP